MACSNYSHLTKLWGKAFAQISVQACSNTKWHFKADHDFPCDSMKVRLSDLSWNWSAPSELDAGLVDFCAEATNKHHKFIHTFSEMHDNITRKQTIPFEEPPVFVTPAEHAAYEHISNKPAGKILDEIGNPIESINDAELQAEVDANLRRKGTVKNNYIEFHNMVSEYVELHVCLEDLPNDDD